MRTSYDASPEAAVERSGLPEKATETTVNGRGTTVPVTIAEWAASLCSRAVQASSIRLTPAASRPCGAGAGAAGAGAAGAGTGATGASGLGLAAEAPGCALAAGAAAWLEAAALAVALAAGAEPVAFGVADGVLVAPEAALTVADGAAPADECDPVCVALRVIAAANPTATTPAATIPAFAARFIVPRSFP
jgi:hypothetical protein